MSPVVAQGRACRTRQIGYQWAYIFSAVRPDTGDDVTLVMPSVNAKVMDLFLGCTLSRYPGPGCARLSWCDGAGWPRRARPTVTGADNVSAGAQPRRRALAVPIARSPHRRLLAGSAHRRTGSASRIGRHYSDLNRCRGGSAIEAALDTTSAGLWGSFVGAYHGLYLGLAAGDKAEGMIFGAIVGAGAGIGIGAIESIREFKGEVATCLRVKGYSVS